MTTLVTAIANGSLYAMVAVGFAIVFRSTNVFNFAQGAIIAVSSLIAFTAVTQWGLSPPFALAVCALAGVAIACTEEIIAVRPITATARTELWLVSTLGVSMVLEAGARVLWGFEPKAVPIPALDHLVPLGNASVKVAAFVAIGFAIAAVVVLELWYSRTRIGKMFSAAAEDRDAAEARGVNTRILALGSFALAGLLGGMAGLLFSPLTFARADLGTLLTIKAFVAMALGGFGSIRGALIGGWAVGLVEIYSGVILGVEYQDIMVFALLIVVLLLLPGGVYGQKVGRVV